MGNSSSITTSLSSNVMSKLVEYRNPQGKEENWLSKAYRYEFQSLPSPLMFFITEGGFALVAIAALVETVVAGVFAIATLPFAFFSLKNNEKNIVWHWAISASFTTVWSISTLFFNMYGTNLFTNEKFARSFIFDGGVSCTGFTISDVYKVPFYEVFSFYKEIDLFENMTLFNNKSTRVTVTKLINAMETFHERKPLWYRQRQAKRYYDDFSYWNMDYKLPEHLTVFLKFYQKEYNIPTRVFSDIFGDEVWGFLRK
jgi:hypothetical protein